METDLAVNLHPWPVVFYAAVALVLIFVAINRQLPPKKRVPAPIPALVQLAAISALALFLLLGTVFSRTEAFGQTGDAMMAFSGTRIDCGNVMRVDERTFSISGSIVIDGVRFTNTKNITRGKYDVLGRDLYQTLSESCHST